ncbi:hypothetical protein niasHS_002745 [Heterodera schachtii]|uniref:Uncharacterized protein n=1 Tax=Heterodera schachtii TaxID=97005 RepID=A0ABD2K2Z0_HETSC
MLKCAEPLQQLGISPGKNLVLLLLQLQSPNQLRNSCQAYAIALPCFRRLVPRCGMPSQAEILRQMENAHQFLCSPFSGDEQSQLLAHRVCIGRILGQMGSGGKGCEATGGSGGAVGTANSNSSTAIVLFRCRERCLADGNGMSESAKFGCLVRAWLSEQNLCLSEQLRAKCGREAAAFYTKMQRKIFHAQFPVICEEKNGWEKTKRKGVTTNESGSKVPSTMAVTQATIFVTSKKRKKTVARLSEFKLKLTGGRRRSSSDSNTTNAAKAKKGNSGSGTATETVPSQTTAATAPPTRHPPLSAPDSPLPSSSAPPPPPPLPIVTSASSSPSTRSFAASSRRFASPSPVPLPSLHSFVPSPSPSLFPSSSPIVSSSVTSSPLFRSSSPSVSPSFANFVPFSPFFANVSSSERNRIIQLLAAQSVPFRFSSMVEQLRKRTESSESGPASSSSSLFSASQKALPVQSPPSQSLPVSSLPSSVRSFSSSPAPSPPSQSLPVSSLPFSVRSFASSPPPPSAASSPHPQLYYPTVPPPPPLSSSSSSRPLSVPPHYFSSSSSFSSLPSTFSSSLFLPPLLPFPSLPSPFPSSSPWVINQFNDFHQKDVPSQAFFFEVLPIDDIIYN